jgi:hypothetical protein
MTFRESPQFHRGQAAERQVAAILRSRDYYVIQSSDYCGPPDDEHAPRAASETDRLILPDLDIARRGQRLWAEVKGKTQPTFTRSTRSSDHGIGLRHYHAYRQMQREFGCFVLIFIVEFRSEMLLMESLDHLGGPSDPMRHCGPYRTYTGPFMDPGGMIFWPRSAFHTRIQFNEIPGLFDPAIPLPFEQRREAQR